MGAGSAPAHIEIILSANTIQQNSANGTAVGTASIAGAHDGMPIWSLIEPLGIFQIDANTGAITVLDNTGMTVAAHPVVPITVSVAGVVPVVQNLVTVIKVTL